MMVEFRAMLRPACSVSEPLPLPPATTMSLPASRVMSLLACRVIEVPLSSALSSMPASIVALADGVPPKARLVAGAGVRPKARTAP